MEASYTYESDGIIKSQTIGKGITTHYTYDMDKNLIHQRTEAAGGWTTGKTAGEIRTEKQKYPQLNVNIGITKNGSHLQNTTAEKILENKTGMEILVDNHYAYDGNGNRTYKQTLSGQTHYGYDSLNRLTEVQYPDGKESFSYDKADNRIRRTTDTTEEQYSYDVCSRLLEKTSRNRNSENSIASAIQGIKREPQTEAPKPLTAEEISSRTNATAGKLPEICSQTNGAIKKPAEPQPDILPFQSRSLYEYDNQGNLIQEVREKNGSKKKKTYTYDGFHRQQKVQTYDGQVQINHYDAEGLHHELEENGKLVQFLYSDREVVAETGTDGTTIRYLRGYELISSDSESARTYYHYVSDEQGSITHILREDEEGNHHLCNQYEYGAFGDYRQKEERIKDKHAHHILYKTGFGSDQKNCQNGGKRY